MPLNPFATGAAVIAGAIAGPLMVTSIAGVLVAAGPATLIVTSVAGPVAGVASLSALQTAIATAFGGMAAGVFSVITRGDDDRRHSRASYTEAIDRSEGCIGGDDHLATQNTDVKEAMLVVGSKRLE